MLQTKKVHGSILHIHLQHTTCIRLETPGTCLALLQQLYVFTLFIAMYINPMQVAESLYAALHPLYIGVINHLKRIAGGGRGAGIRPQHIICPECLASNSLHYSIN